MTKGFIILIILITSGCCCLQDKEPELKPLPPEKLHDLLHISENYAYKSITKEDYIIKENLYFKMLNLEYISLISLGYRLRKDNRYAC